MYILQNNRNLNVILSRYLAIKKIYDITLNKKVNQFQIYSTVVHNM